MLSNSYIVKVFHFTFTKFVMVGVINTIIGTTIMFVLYNVAISYFLNKHFTFRFQEKGWHSLGRFIITILICYLLAYGIAKPIMKWILSDYSVTIQENISMLLGMCLFVAFNYIGQRFYAFKL